MTRDQPTEVQCSACSTPVVVFLDPTSGYQLRCGCPETAVPLDAVAAEANAFTPVTGKWAQLDDPNWDDVRMDDDDE